MKPKFVENFFQKVLNTETCLGNGAVPLADDDDESSEDEDYVCSENSDDDDETEDSSVNTNSSSSSSRSRSGDSESDGDVNSRDNNENEQASSPQSTKLNGKTKVTNGKRKYTKLRTKRSKSSNDEETETEGINAKKTQIKCTVAASVSNGKKKQTVDSLNSKQTKPTEINGPFRKVCCVCLNEGSESSDEIVQCDSCGFFTHEGCYGITDSDSKDSSDSLASTEPWFCNSCLSGDHLEKKKNNKNSSDSKYDVRHCELCPNVNCGLLKETDSGQFVHIVCAIYLPEITFEDTDSLWPVVLNKIPAKKWAEKVCSLCDNVLYARTGVCIKCDAGLCKNYFHATCALKHGLTVDPMQSNIDPSDPFFAYCKQHNDSTIIKQRKLSYAQMIAHYNSSDLTNGDNQNKERLKMKFINAKNNYQLKRESAQIPRKELKKTPRMLTACPYTFKSLMEKRALLNEIPTDEQIVLLNGPQSSRHIPGSTVQFTPEFVKYFHEREKFLKQYQHDLPKLKKNQLDLTNQEAILLEDYEKKVNQRKIISETYEKESRLLAVYTNLIEKVFSSKSTAPTVPSQVTNLLQLNLDEQPETKPSDDQDSNFQMNISSLNSNSSRRSSTTFNTTSATYNNNTSQQLKRTYRKRKQAYQDTSLGVDSECSVCKQKTNSHLLVQCDTCKLIYHINCLEPPLSSVPKKTKLYGWECSKCVRKKDSDYEENEEEELTNENDLTGSSNNNNKMNDSMLRSLRRERKLTHSKETFELEQLINLATKKKETRGRKKGYKKAKKNENKRELSDESEVNKKRAKKLKSAASTSMASFSDAESPKRKYKKKQLKTKSVDKTATTTTTTKTTATKRKSYYIKKKDRLALAASLATTSSTNEKPDESFNNDESINNSLITISANDTLSNCSTEVKQSKKKLKV